MCGIGGRSIAEARENLSYAEFCSWLRYRNQRGSLNPGLRVEFMIGQFMSFYGNSKTNNRPFSVYDFTPNIEEPPVSLDVAIEKWK